MKLLGRHKVCHHLNLGRRQVKNSGVDTDGERGEREPTTGV